MEYQIEPIELEGFGAADGVVAYEDGTAYLGELITLEDEESGEVYETVSEYIDVAGGSFVPAPEDWRERIIKAL